MTNKLVSVIIPTYGGSDSLEYAIESVLMQNYDNFEIIVVDDNNPNTEGRKKTDMIMQKYIRNNRVKYIKHKKNLNGAAARNTGAKASRGEYLALLDDDDVFLQNKLKKQVDYLETHKEFDAVYCWRFENSRIITSNLEGNLSAELLDLSFTPCTDALMLRKKSYFDIGGFDETYIRHQDFEFLLRFFKHYKIGVVKDVLLKIVGNDIDNQPRGQKIVDTKKKFLNTFDTDINEINTNIDGYKKKVYARHYADVIIKLLRYGDIILAIKVYLTEGRKGGCEFWKELIDRLLKIINKKRECKRQK